MQPSPTVTPKVDHALWVVLGLATLLLPVDLTLGSGGFLTDTLLVGITGYYGLSWARESEAPILWRGCERGKSGRYITIALISTTVLISIINAYITLNYFRTNDLSSTHWKLVLSTPWKGLLCSLRAGITEEIPFRLLVGPLVLMLLRRNASTTRHIWWLAPLLTAIPFCLLLHPGVPTAYASSLLLSVIYYRHGILPAIFAHALIDAAWQVLVPVLGLI